MQRVPIGLGGEERSFLIISSFVNSIRAKLKGDVTEWPSRKLWGAAVEPSEENLSRWLPPQWSRGGKKDPFQTPSPQGNTPRLIRLITSNLLKWLRSTWEGGNHLGSSSEDRDSTEKQGCWATSLMDVDTRTSPLHIRNTKQSQKHETHKTPWSSSCFTRNGRAVRY